MQPTIWAKGRRPNPLAPGWEPLALPCGQCIGCRLEHSRNHAVRIMHEAQLWDYNRFVTLTYDNDHIPVDGCVSKRELQLFMKKLRRRYPQKIRFFACGEYGENFERPHYHACLFNVHFDDEKKYREDRENTLWNSEKLNNIWGKGLCVIGELTFESAAYVARYVCKKVTGKRAEEHYLRDDALTGAVRQLTPEFALMSRNKGLASEWFDEFETDVYPFDEVICRGHPAKPPRYYDKLLEARDLDKFNQVKLKREAQAQRFAHDNTPARLWDREIVKTAQQREKTRRYET